MIRGFLDELGAAIEAYGLAAAEDDVAVAVAAARAHGLHGVALDVLADATAPEVARCRALARLAPLLIARSSAVTAPRAEEIATVVAATAAGPVLDGAGC